ncbi:MAG: ATP12 family protein [Erythrobacter sp.]|nr:ATP12 family protein [Erythrobacter sp.]
MTKRFYDAAELTETKNGWQVTLDGRAVRTQGGQAQIVRARALGEALVGEWNAQGETLDPRAFPVRDLTDYALDVVTRDRDAVANQLLAYGDTDTLLYRAGPDEPLFARQQAVWEPIVTAFEARESVALTRISGIVHRPQSAAAMSALKTRLAAFGPVKLAATEMMTKLAASLVTGLSALRPEEDAAALWAAASLEEEWQAELWGRDEEAETRRDARRAAFLMARDVALRAGEE